MDPSNKKISPSIYLIKTSNNRNESDYEKIFDNNTLYFALPNELQIAVFEKNNFAAPINQYATSGIPLFLEIFDTKIVSVNQNDFGYSIETIPK